MRTTYQLWICISFCLATPFWCTSQTPSFRYLGSEQGMNSLASWNCTIDKYGFFWIATNDGLLRFDGKAVSYYYQHTHPELPVDQIGFLCCDSRNNVWVCTNKGLVKINEERELIRQDIIPGQADADVDICFEDGLGSVYAMTSYGTYSLKPGELKWKPEVWLDSLLEGRRIRDIRRFDTDRYLFTLPAAGVILINFKDKKPDLFVPLKGVNCATRFDDTSILIGKSGSFGLILASFKDTLTLHTIPPPSFFRGRSDHEQINFIVRAADHRVYMTTFGEGLVSLDSTLSQFSRFTHDPANSTTIVDNSLRYIFADSTGILLMTSVNGVNYTNVFNTAVEYINYLKLDDGSLMDKSVLSVAEDKLHRLWICTENNVFIYDQLNNSTSRIPLPAHITFKRSDLSPIYVERDQYDNMWVALRREGILVYNADGVFSRFITSADYPGFGDAINRPRVIKEGHDGYMYIGTEEGLYRMQHSDFRLDTFLDDPLLEQLRHQRIIDILPKQDELWVTSSPGGAAWHYSFTEKRLNKFSSDNGLLTNRLYGLTGDPLGNIYIGSYAGLSIIHPDRSITNIIKGEGLTSPRIESIETADDGTIWIANNYNLLKYDPINNLIYTLGGRQGLMNINFTVMGSTTLSNGRLAFGASKGLIIIDPATIKFGTDSLTLFVFYRDEAGREVEWRPGKKLEVSYKQQNLQFSFGVNDIMVADQVLYSYRLAHHGTLAWSEPALRSTVDFNLNPGAYTLEVKAFDGHAWYSLRHPIQISISPPWWKQWWFLSLMAMSMIVAVWFYFKGRSEKYRKEIMVTGQILELESKALRAQMNPHFVFNSLNAIQECIVTGRVEEAYAYLSKFSRLLRLVLEHSEMTEVSLNEELEVLSLYISLEKLRFKDDMHYDFRMNDELDPEEIYISPMLIQPHLENAIWHGLRHKEGEKKLLLAIAETLPGYLDVIIEDNGIGRVKAAELSQKRLGGDQHKSKGKQLSGSRLELLQKEFPHTSMLIVDLYDEKGVASGTRVELVIPILVKKREG